MQCIARAEQMLGAPDLFPVLQQLIQTGKLLLTKP
jgi:hypothetical protein